MPGTASNTITATTASEAAAGAQGTPMSEMVIEGRGFNLWTGSEDAFHAANEGGFTMAQTSESKILSVRIAEGGQDYYYGSDGWEQFNDLAKQYTQTLIDGGVKSVNAYISGNTMQAIYYQTEKPMLLKAGIEVIEHFIK